MTRPSFLHAWLLAALALFCTAPGVAAELRLDQAQTLVSPAERLPPALADGAGMRLRALPDTWGRDDGPVVWYRVALPPAAPGADLAPLALYIERVCSQVEVQLNGVALWGAGPRPLCHRPQLLPLPGALLQAQGNRLDLRVSGSPLAQVASLGQVHEGLLRSGETVAIKIQFPDLQKSFDEQLGLLRQVSKAGPPKKFRFEMQAILDYFADSLRRKARKR